MSVVNGVIWRGAEVRQWEMRICFFRYGVKDSLIDSIMVELFYSPEEALRRYREVIEQKIDPRYHYLYGL